MTLFRNPVCEIGYSTHTGRLNFYLFRWILSTFKFSTHRKFVLTFTKGGGCWLARTSSIEFIRLPWSPRFLSEDLKSVQTRSLTFNLDSGIETALCSIKDITVRYTIMGFKCKSRKIYIKFFKELSGVSKISITTNSKRPAHEIVTEWAEIVKVLRSDYSL